MAGTIDNTALTKRTGLVTGSTAALRTVKLQPNKGLSVMLDLTAGTPATGALLQVTNDGYDVIDAGTANFVTPDQLTATLVDKVYTATSPTGCQLTAIRVTITDGTWTMIVRQDE